MASRDPERYFDQRTIKRHLKRGLVAEGEFERFLDGLPDVSDKIKPQDEGGDEDGFDGRGRPKHTSPVATLLAGLRTRAVDYDDDDDDDDDDDFDDDDDAEPVASEPVASEPVASEPLMSEPVASEPVASEPLVSEPLEPSDEPLA